MIENLNIESIVFVFLASLISNVLWAFYIRRTSQGHAFWSSTVGAAITLVGAYIILSYVDNKLYLIPTIIGGFIGQYFTMKYDARNKR